MQAAAARAELIVWQEPCSSDPILTMPAVHDRGGLPTDGPIDRSEHQWEDWEHVTNALVGVLRRRNLINVDELRRGIEAMAPEEYESSSYYERWSASIETLLVEKGILAEAEIDAVARKLDSEWER